MLTYPWLWPHGQFVSLVELQGPSLSAQDGAFTSWQTIWPLIALGNVCLNGPSQTVDFIMPCPERRGKYGNLVPGICWLQLAASMLLVHCAPLAGVAKWILAVAVAGDIDGLAGIFCFCSTVACDGSLKTPLVPSRRNIHCRRTHLVAVFCSLVLAHSFVIVQCGTSYYII
jgi:hypothetical protein